MFNVVDSQAFYEVAAICEFQTSQPAELWAYHWQWQDVFLYKIPQEY